MKKTLSIILTAAMTAMAFTTSVSAFTDTTELNDTQMTILNNAVENGIIKGYEDDTVRPYNTLTRAEFAAMLCRAFGYSTGNGCSFSDAATHWGSAYIQACVDKGAINGIGNNLFDPEAPVTFYQASKIVTIVSGMTINYNIDSMGGYPLAYLTIGQNGSLYTNTTAGFTGEDYNLCRIDAITMIANAGTTNNNQTIDTNNSKSEAVGENTISKSTVEGFIDFAAYDIADTAPIKTDILNTFISIITGEKERKKAEEDMRDEFLSSAKAAGLSGGTGMDNYFLAEKKVETALTYFYNAGYHIGVTIVDE